jgi:hypothetical protein
MKSLGDLLDAIRLGVCGRTSLRLSGASVVNTPSRTSFRLVIVAEDIEFESTVRLIDSVRAGVIAFPDFRKLSAMSGMSKTWRSS